MVFYALFNMGKECVGNNKSVSVYKQALNRGRSNFLNIIYGQFNNQAVTLHFVEDSITVFSFMRLGDL